MQVFAGGERVAGSGTRPRALSSFIRRVFTGGSTKPGLGCLASGFTVVGHGGWSGTLAKDVEQRFFSGQDEFLARFHGSATITFGGEVTVYIDELKGTVTLVGPEDKVYELVEVLEMGYFASGVSRQQEVKRKMRALHGPTGTLGTTAGPRASTFLCGTSTTIRVAGISGAERARGATSGRIHPAGTSAGRRCATAPKPGCLATTDEPVYVPTGHQSLSIMADKASAGVSEPISTTPGAPFLATWSEPCFIVVKPPKHASTPVAAAAGGVKR